MSAETENEGTSQIVACAVARDIEAFDLLTEDMETEFGEDWGALTFDAAASALTSDIGAGLKYITVAVDKQDEQDLTPVANVIRTAQEQGIKVVLIPHELDTVALHQLMRMGSDDFRPTRSLKGRCMTRLNAFPKFLNLLQLLLRPLCLRIHRAAASFCLFTALRVAQVQPPLRPTWHGNCRNLAKKKVKSLYFGFQLPIRRRVHVFGRSTHRSSV